MADAGFFKGTSADQDRRFSDKELKLLKTMKFPPEFDKKVDMRKVNLNVIRPWIAKKVVELVGFEDEVVVEYAMGLLEDKQEPFPDPKKMQINLTGFLTKDTPDFMTSLWKLLIEAQSDMTGVPRTFVEEKKEELRKARERDGRAIDERDRRARLDELRDDRGDRGGRGGRGGRGRGRGRGRGFDDDRGGRPRDGGWGGRGGGPRRRMSRSRSPPPRRRSRTPPSSAGSRSPRRYRSPVRRRSSSRGIHSSRSPSLSHRQPPKRRSPSRFISRTPPPSSRRRPRSPSLTPRSNARYRDSRSPPARRRRISRGPSSSRSPSRSRSPPSRSYGKRRRSVSPPRRRRSPSRSRSPPRRRSPARGGRGGRYARSHSGGSRSRSRSPPRADDKMDVDIKPAREELKIKGQAEVAKKKSKWDDDPPKSTESEATQSTDLEQRESELKERALRNKVVRTRKSSGSGN